MADHDIDLDEIFAYHPPTTDDVREGHEEVRRILREACKDVHFMLPPCPEATLFVRRMQEAMHYANSAIAQHQFANLDPR
jgi:predicted secreted protein